MLSYDILIVSILQAFYLKHVIKMISKGIKMISSFKIKIKLKYKKMVMETKLSILNALEKNSDGLHLRKLTEVVDGSFPNIRRFVHVLESEGVVKTKQQGNLLNITLAESLQTVAYLKFVHTSRFMSLPPQFNIAMNDIFSQIQLKPTIALLVPASNQKKYVYNIVFVFQTIDRSEEIKQLIARIAAQHHILLDPVLIDYASFERGLLDKNHTFSKRIKEESIILLGTEYYYRLIWRSLR